MDETLWPEYQALACELDRWLQAVTDKVIREALHDDTSEVAERAGDLPPPG